MTFLGRMSLSTRLMAIILASLAIVTTITVVLALWMERQNMIRQAAGEVEFGLAMFTASLPRDAQGFAETDMESGAGTDILRTAEEVRIAPRVVDRIHDLMGVHVTYFRFLPETGEFERVMTSIQAADGTRAVGTVLDPTGPAHAALSAGTSYVGKAQILGLPYLTQYVPVRDASGDVVGAVFAGKSVAMINGLIVETLLYIAVPSILVLIATLFLSKLLIRRTLQPVRDIVGIVKRLEKREYDVAIASSQTRDEIGELGRACIALRDDLRDGAAAAERAAAQEAEREELRVELARVVSDLRSGLARLAEGDLLTQIGSTADNPFPTEYESLRQSYNDVIERFGEVINQVNVIARSVRDSAAEITDASRELSTRAETQAATLEQSAAALTELTQSVASTAERAGKAQEASFDNQKGAERGAAIVREAVLAMQGIEKGSEQITRIISVIEDIAFQTNLLALNAGVEAARAGDAGRGFAVVASEVRLLAQRASESAREIKGLISDSTDRVGEGSTLVRKTGESLSEILGRANDAASLVADIAMAAAEQARGLAEVNAGVNQLDHVTQQNSAVAEETSAAAATLQSRSEELIMALAGFRTRQRAVSAPVDMPRDKAAGRDTSRVQANVVDWTAAAAAAANGPRANPVRVGAAWSEF